MYNCTTQALSVTKLSAYLHLTSFLQPNNEQYAHIIQMRDNDMCASTVQFAELTQGVKPEVAASKQNSKELHCFVSNHLKQSKTNVALCVWLAYKQPVLIPHLRQF